MVTRKCDDNLYRLHFFDLNNEQDVFENVISRNVYTLRYYANKMERTKNLMLVDFYEISIMGNYIWLTKWDIIPRERYELRYYLYYRDVASILKTFDQFLGINE
jgi:hypothetical protein